jgi:hypothetical protein
VSSMTLPPTSTSNENVSRYGQPDRRQLDQLSDQEIIDLNDRWFNRVVDGRRHVERDALLNIAFLLDHHYLTVSKVGKTVQLTPIKEKEGRVRTVEQIIEPAVRSEMARLLRTKPQGVVIPQGEDPEDYEAARAADQGLSYVLQAHDVEEYLEQSALWMLVGGTTLLSTGWDENKIDEFDQRGDYYFRSLSPFEFGVPQIRKWKLEDQPYVMVTKAYELDEIFERWGIEVSADRNEKFGSLDDRLSAIVSTSASNTPRSKGSEETKVPMAIVKETWIKPGHLAPDGAVLITSAGKILDLQPWPEWTHRKYPFYKLEYFRVPGSFWAKPMVTSMIPIQRRHNRAVSVVVETMNTLAQTRIAGPRNTQVRGILGGKGVMFETPMGSTQGVSNISVPPIGDLPFQELNNTRIAIRDIAHQHEVSRGHTPPNVRSGTAIATLKELDDTASLIPVRSIERAAQNMGRHILHIMKSMWQQPRFIYVLGSHGDIETRSFLAGHDVGGQYVVQPGSTFPYSKTERQALVFANLEAGLITPDEAIHFQDMGTPRGILQERDLPIRHARRENQRFEDMSAIDPNTGEPSVFYIQQQFMQLLPADWHDHQAHLYEHNKIRMSPSYERWDTWKRAMFEAHIAGHQTALQAQMEQMQGIGMPSEQAMQLPEPGAEETA